MEIHFEFTGVRESGRLELLLYEISSAPLLLGRILLSKRLAVFMSIMAASHNTFVNFYQKYTSDSFSKDNIRGRIGDIRRSLSAVETIEPKSLINRGIPGEWGLLSKSVYVHPLFIDAIGHELSPCDLERLVSNPGSPLSIFGDDKAT